MSCTVHVVPSLSIYGHGLLFMLPMHQSRCRQSLILFVPQFTKANFDKTRLERTLLQSSGYRVFRTLLGFPKFTACRSSHRVTLRAGRIHSSIQFQSSECTSRSPTWPIARRRGRSDVTKCMLSATEAATQVPTARVSSLLFLSDQ